MTPLLPALIISTGAYVALGGLRVVVYTEVFQTIALVLGGFVMMFYSFTRVGGWSGLKATLENATTVYPELEPVPEHYFHVMRPVKSPWQPTVCSRTLHGSSEPTIVLSGRQPATFLHLLRRALH